MDAMAETTLTLSTNFEETKSGTFLSKGTNVRIHTAYQSLLLI